MIHSFKYTKNILSKTSKISRIIKNKNQINRFIRLGADWTRLKWGVLSQVIEHPISTWCSINAKPKIGWFVTVCYCLLLFVTVLNESRRAGWEYLVQMSLAIEVVESSACVFQGQFTRCDVFSRGLTKSRVRVYVKWSMINDQCFMFQWSTFTLICIQVFLSRSSSSILSNLSLFM